MTEYSYEIEYIVCRLDQTWFNHIQEEPFIHALDTADLSLLEPPMRAIFNLEGDFAYIGLYNITEVETEEEVSKEDNSLTIVLNALRTSLENIGYELERDHGKEGLAAWQADENSTAAAVKIVEKLIEDEANGN